MKQLCLGNNLVDHLHLRFDSASQAEDLLLAEAELQAGWFAAKLPLVAGKSEIQQFLVQLANLDRTLSGSALLETKSANGTVAIELHALPLGHIKCAVRAVLDGNSLECAFNTDQTQLGALLRWWESALAKFESQHA